MKSEVNIPNVAKKFTELLKGGPVILYIGSSYNLVQQNSITDQYWSCIYTARKDPEIASLFHKKDRQVQSITNYQQVYENGFQLSRLSPPLIYLNGDQPNFVIDLLSPAEETEYKKNQKRLYNALTSMMTNSFASLVIVGYDVSNPDEIDPRTLYSLLYMLGKRSVYFFGMDQDTAQNKYIENLESEQIATLYPCDLSEVLRSDDIKVILQDEVEEIDYDNSKYTLYVDGVARPIKENIYYDFQRYGQLLTIKNMSTMRINRTMMVDWFYQFLKLSPNSPQWYGYDSKTAFNIKRDYERVLEEHVQMMFHCSEGANKPILLCGQTSSGKSISIASLAYKVFHERKYPVIYITNPDITFNIGSAGFNTLSTLMQELEDLGAKRILIVWDCTIANLQKDTRLQQLVIDLSNRGRKPFLIIGSAMDQGDKLDKKVVGVQESIRGYSCIYTPIKLNPKERKDLKNLLIEKGKLPTAQVERFMQEYPDDNLLSLLYNMVYWIHPQLEQGLGMEILKAISATEQELQELPPPQKIEKELTVLGMQLQGLAKELGLISPSNNVEDEMQEVDWAAKLKSFCTYIAICSQFKLSMPTVFAMRLLSIPATKENLNLKEKIFSAPWLVDNSQSQTINDNYSVSFRTPIEAKIYLADQNISPEKQMSFVAQMIRFLASEKDWDEDFSCDSSTSDMYYLEEVRFIERLIRTVGPNSEFSYVSSKESQYHDGVPYIIEALTELRNKYRIWEPLLISQEITYIREYYSNNITFTPENRCEWLEKAIKLAQEAIEVRQRMAPTGKGYDGLANSINVERTFSEMHLQKIYDELNIRAEQRRFVPTYLEQYDRLLKIINDNPRNSYAYTALLRAFMLTIDNSDLKDIDKLSYLGDILELVEEADAHVEEVSTNEEFIKASSEFYSYVDLITGENRANEYFNELLEKGSATGIYLKAHQTIRKGEINFKNPIELKNGALNSIVLEAITLLENKSTWDVVSKHIGCLYLLLRLKWLYYNKKPIFNNGEERQLTAMNYDQWTEIGALCEQLRLQIIRQNENQRVFYATTILYLLGLSKAQVKDYSGAEETFRSIREESFAKPGRTWTWHILCDEKGNPIPFHGVLDSKHYNPDDFSGRVYIPEMKRLVYYSRLSFIGKSEPKGTSDNLCIGTTYTRFTAYSIDKLGRREKK